MIAVDVPALPAGEVARRAAVGRLPCWLVTPGEPGGVLRDVIACDPVQVVRGSSLPALERAWEEARARWQAGPGVPVGVGWLSYDLGRPFMRLRSTPPPPSGWADLEFRFYDAVWVQEAGRTQIWATSTAAAARLRAWLEAPVPAEATTLSMQALAPVEPPERHVANVRRVLAYIRAGDVYQVNLARRLRARLTAPGAPGLALFARLRMEAEAPHAVWLGDPEEGRALVGNSPERFLRVTTDGVVETRPIKGTRPRGATADEDRRLAEELVHAEKDRAEHVMIVDLERNDLGRVCLTGSVAVTALTQVVSLPTVFHLVSTVGGRLRPGVGSTELLAATFPGGSITGAPKRRAMEIIDELEPACRGPYTGATGWLGGAGDLDLAVAIRTALVRGEELTLWVGGGIVADSDAEAELAETTAKAEAFRRLCAV